MGLNDPDSLYKYVKLGKMLNSFMPTYRIKIGGPFPAWAKHFVEDPLYQGQHITPHNLMNVLSSL
jgi:hypothetical protein